MPGIPSEETERGLTLAEEAVVVACGLMTPVGLSAPETAASARSRLQRLGEIEVRDRRYRRIVAGFVPEDGLPDLNPAAALLPWRAGRMLRLAEVPLNEALKPLPKDAGPIPLMLGLPEIETAIPLDPAKLFECLEGVAPVSAKESKGFTEGRASAILALAAGVERVASGKSPWCVIGGVDSQIDLSILATLDLKGRIRNAANPDGLAPSEGAAFLLLTTAAEAKRRKLRPLAKIVTCASGFEKGHIASEEPYRGDGLAETFTAAFDQAGDLNPVGCVYASFNGERYWAKEFGVAFLRNRAKFDPAHQMEHPAECFGDLGAAHGAALLALACLGIDGGYRRAPTLVYSSSDHGRRGVALVDAVKPDGEGPSRKGAL